jgi:hypothetical protein
MSGARREKNTADFDLERLFDMVDEALTSPDPRVQNALRSLLMIVELTRPQPDGTSKIEDRRTGPLRRMQEDLNHVVRRLSTLEDQMRSAEMRTQEGAAYTWAQGAYKDPWASPVAIDATGFNNLSRVSAAQISRLFESEDSTDNEHHTNAVLRSNLQK